MLRKQITKLQSFDIFGADVNFYYKGEDKFKTPWGCIVTIFVALSYLSMVSLKLIEFNGGFDGIEFFSERN